MAVSYKYEVELLEHTNDDLKFVVAAHWVVKAREDELFARAGGVQVFELDAEKEGFIAYEDLTEEVVLGWIKEQVAIEELEAELEKRIDEQRNPKVLAGLPW